MIVRNLFSFMWLAWILYWWASSRNVKDTVREETVASRLSHMLPLIIAAALIAPTRFAPSVLDGRFVPRAWWPFVAGALMCAAGLLFSVWARVHIGRNWSGTVTLKKDHELVTGGPYAIVRHPIYTGLLLAFAGSALARGEWRGVLAVVIVFVALWRKLRLEERWMREQFGPAYEAYSARVKALIPFIL